MSFELFKNTSHKNTTTPTARVCARGIMLNVATTTLFPVGVTVELYVDKTSNLLALKKGEVGFTVVKAYNCAGKLNAHPPIPHKIYSYKNTSDGLTIFA